MKTKTMVLVSCVKRKKESRERACDLYTSPWFIKAMAYASDRGTPFVLSAKHGVIDIDEEIAPYDETLVTLGVSERKQWAAGVVKQIDALRIERGFTDLIVLAGQRYREFLAPALEQFERVEIPMKGLGIGQQLQWLNNKVAVHV